MSFNSRDLMIDVLPSHRFNDPAGGFAMCGQVTANTGKDESDDETEGGECPQVTAVTTNEAIARTGDGLNLALLQRQMRTAISAAGAAEA
jgi:hypothetical protein